MRLLLIDGHPIFRLGLMELVQSRWPDARVDEADSLDSARETLSAFGAFDLAVLSLPSESVEAAALAARAVSIAKAAPILALGGADADLASELLALGARGVATREQSSGELLDAIGRVASGARYVAPEIADRIVAKLMREAGDGIAEMPDAELRALRLLAGGRNAQAAEEARSADPTNPAGTDPAEAPRTRGADGSTLH